MNPEIIGLYISAFAALIAGGSIFLAWRQLRETHDWNRRKSSDDALRFLVSGDYQRLTDQFHKIVPLEEWSKQNTSYTDTSDGLSDEQRSLAVKLSWDLLNVLESICIGMKNQIIDEDICYDYLAFILPRFFHWSRPFIDERRESANEPRLYTELEDFAIKWDSRKERENLEARKAIQTQGKPRL